MYPVYADLALIKRSSYHLVCHQHAFFHKSVRGISFGPVDVLHMSSEVQYYLRLRKIEVEAVPADSPGCEHFEKILKDS